MIGKTSSVTAYVLALKKRNVSSSSIYFQTHILFESKINKGFTIFYINSSPRTLFWVLQHSQLSPRNTVWVLQHHPLHPLHGQRARALFPGCSDSASPYFFFKQPDHTCNKLQYIFHQCAICEVGQLRITQRSIAFHNHLITNSDMKCP